MSVAHVEGDNLADDLEGLLAAGHELRNMDTGTPLSEWGVQPMAANAYLGGWGIAAALDAGVDIVICGRVTDASLTVGAAAWWHGWRRSDWDRIAAAVTAGHVVECGPHAVGGNFSGFTGISGIARPGFPIVEIDSDGRSVVTKHVRDGGEVTVDTVTAQLLYEIQGPRYANPDAVAQLDTLRLHRLGPDRVELSGIRGSPPPPTAKVALFAQIGYQVVTSVYATGLDLERKIALLRAQLADMLWDEDVELEITQLGSVATDPRRQWDATVQVRIMATGPEPEPLRRLAERVGELYLSSIPGFFTDTAARSSLSPRPRIDYWPALLDTSMVRHEVVFGDGHRVRIAPPPEAEVPRQPEHPEPTPTGGAVRELDTRRVPLGRVAHARCGDKGGNSNVGIWVSDPRAWTWLRSELSTDRLRQLMPEIAQLEVVRHEFPHLRAVHFVLRGLLGSGGSSNRRVDPIGKAVGEFLRARHVDVPRELLG